MAHRETEIRLVDAEATAAGQETAHHQIEVTLVDGHALVDVPLPGVMHVGDTVSYHSNQGPVRVVFELPFSDTTDVLDSGERRILRHPGRFVGKCSIVQADGTEVGWTSEDPSWGGEHDVRP